MVSKLAHQAELSLLSTAKGTVWRAGGEAGIAEGAGATREGIGDRRWPQPSRRVPDRGAGGLEPLGQ